MRSKRHVHSLSVLLGTSALTSCGWLGSFVSENPYGVQNVIDPVLIDEVDLIRLLDPLNRSWVTASMSPEEKLGRALDAFYTRYGTTREDLMRRRDGVQERILIASSQLAAEYERYLKRYDSAANFSLGSLTTALAGMGSIFTDAGTVRALAGSAAITSGVRAEWNETMFSRVTIQVLVKGIRSRRTKLYAEIVAKRSNKAVHEYTVEQAIKDAIDYHGAFNLIVGLEESAIALERQDNPGLAELSKVLESKFVKQSLGIGGTPELGPDASAATDALSKALVPFATELGTAGVTHARGTVALDAVVALSTDPPIIASLTAIDQARSDLVTAAKAIETAIIKARQDVAEEATKKPSAEALREEMATAAVDAQRLGGDELTKAKDRLRLAIAKAAIKTDELRSIAIAQAKVIEQAAATLTRKADASVDAAVKELEGLKSAYLPTLYTACDNQLKLVTGIQPGSDVAKIVREAREQIANGEAVAARIEAAVATLADQHPELKTLTAPLRDSLRLLNQALTKATQ